jgi:uncharacterized protein YaaW (UPF0174 family)
MAYRRDPDLEFLKKCTSEDLSILVGVLTEDTDGETRWTEELTGNERYKANFPNHRVYWDLVAAELQCFGASSVATIFRGGKGIMYREVLSDVCDKLKVNGDSQSSVETIELNLLMKILADSMEKMTPEQLKEIVGTLDLKTTSYTKQAVVAALQAGVAMSGFVAYQIAVIVANAVAKAVVGRGLALAANAGLARAVGIFAGPIGWAVTAVWTLIDVAGPAYRVTMPAVIQVAFLRAKMNHMPPGQSLKLRGRDWV